MIKALCYIYAVSVIIGYAFAQSADSHLAQLVDTTNMPLPSGRTTTRPEYRSTESGILISYPLSDMDAEEMLSIVRQHTKEAILSILLNNDGSVSVGTGMENVSGTVFIFRRENEKWILIKQRSWLS